MREKRCCVVVPVYKETLNDIERISLERYQSVSGDKYDVYVVCPDNMDISAYAEIIPSAVPVYFDKRWFEGYKSYSQLCMSKDLYSRFADYEYMLIYQTDCYLVRDEIERWCDEGYDYIGAPIFYAWDPRSIQTGNGGLSLRKVSTFSEIFDPDSEYMQEFGETVSDVEFEDAFICMHTYAYVDFKKCNWRKAAYFAWDMNPDILMDKWLTEGKLPMGLHAIDKNIFIYRQMIPELSNIGDSVNNLIGEMVSHHPYLNEYLLSTTKYKVPEHFTKALVG